MSSAERMEPKNTKEETGGGITSVAVGFVQNLLRRHQGGARHESFAQMVAGKYLTGLSQAVTGPLLVFRRRGVRWGDREAEPGDAQTRWSESYRYYGHVEMKLSQTSAVAGLARDRFSAGGSDTPLSEVRSKPGGKRLLRQVATFSAPAIQRKETVLGVAPQCTHAGQETRTGPPAISGQLPQVRPVKGTPKLSVLGTERIATVLGSKKPWLSSWHKHQSEAGLKVLGKAVWAISSRRERPVAEMSVAQGAWPALGKEIFFKRVLARHGSLQRTSRENISRWAKGDHGWLMLGLTERVQVDTPQFTSPPVASHVPSSQLEEAPMALNRAGPWQTSKLEELSSRGMKRADLIMGETPSSVHERPLRDAARGLLPLSPTTMLFRMPPVLEPPVVPVELVRQEIQSQMRSLQATSHTSESKPVDQPSLPISSVADRVFHLLERRLIVERERRGLFS